MCDILVICEIVNSCVSCRFCSALQCGNMAREGLRTLVVAKKVLTEDQYQEFEVCTFISIGRQKYSRRF